MSVVATTTLPMMLALMIASHLCYAQVGLRIRPDSNDAGRFVGQEFRRTCALTVDNQAGVRIEWLLDGTSIHTDIGSSLLLSISSVELSNAGTYTCKAILSDGTVLGPINAGRLSVFDTSPIVVPSNQYIVYGNDTTLNCSYNDPSIGAHATVERNDEVVSNQITGANLDDEGEYVCDIFISNPRASIQRSFTVHVIVPLELITHPPALERIEGNPQRSLLVIFRGRIGQNITWYKDGRPLPANRVTTTYNSINLSGNTSLDFPAIQRKDSGVYRVVLEGMLGAEFLPRGILYREISFQVNVEVPPTVPENFRVVPSTITSVFARIQWENTNLTVDAGAERLVVILTYSNMSLVREIELPGNVEQESLDLIPGTNYTVRLRAENPDGMVITDPKAFKTLPGPPKVNKISVRQVGETANFEVSTSLAYTGGSAISSFQVSYRLSTSGEFTKLDNVGATSSSDPLVWTGTFIISNPDIDLATDVKNMQFLVFVTNRDNYKSNGSIVSVTQSEPTTTSSAGETGASGSADLPFWLYVIVAVLGTILVTITVVFVCIFTVRCCVKSRKNANKYQVNSQKGFRNEIVQGPENGGQRYVDVPDPVPNNAYSLPRSDPQPLDMNRTNALHHNDSMPSIKTNSSSPTPQPDDQLLKRQKLNYIHHQKYPSDASSIIKRGPTPSTTASSSPAPATIKAAYEQRLQSENVRGSVNSSVHMEQQYMPHCQQHVQQGSGEIENQQSSQTESETVQLQMQNESCSYQHPHHRHDSQQFSDRHSHQSLSISQSGSIPMYRVGTSTSNTSVPTCSSMQGSQPSLNVNGSSSVLFHHFPTPHHHHPTISSYPTSYGLPAGSVTGRAEVGIVCNQPNHLVEADLVSGSQKSPAFIIV